MGRLSGKQLAFVLAILGGLALLAFLISLRSAQGDSRREIITQRSVYNSQPSGYRAWFLATEKAGLPIDIWRKPFSQLGQLPEPAAMLIVEPYTMAQSDVTFGEKEVDSLLGWVTRGNSLILLDDFKRHGAAHLLERLSLKLMPASKETGKAGLDVVPKQTFLKSYIRGPIETGAGTRFDPQRSRRTFKVLLADDAGHPSLIHFNYGKGHIVLGTAVDLGGNAHLHSPENGNYQLLGNLLALEKMPIVVNEFVHGYFEVEDIFAYYRQHTPLGLIFMQLFFGFCFMLWLSFGNRPGGKTGLSGEQHPAASGPEGFIESLSGIYYRHHAASMALAPQLNRIEEVLRRRYRIGLHEEDRLRHLLERLPDAYSNRDASLDVLKEARKLVDSQESLSHARLLGMTRQLNRLRKQLQETGKH